MKVNVKKVKSEMKRLGINREQLGEMVRPKMTRQAIDYVFNMQSTKLKTLNSIARALALDPKDLLI